MNGQQKIISDELYNLAMRLTDIGVKNVDSIINHLCLRIGVSYPPQQMEVTT